MLIGLAGAMRSGKDTVGAILTDKHGFERLAFADVLKSMAEDIDPFVVHNGVPHHLSELLDWTDERWDYAKQNPSVRYFLQRLGVAIRNVDPDFWVRNVGDIDGDKRIVITDMRFPNEVDFVLKNLGHAIRVVRPGYNGNGHVSETALDGYPLPEIINDGTLEELEHKVDALVLSLGGWAS